MNHKFFRIKTFKMLLFLIPVLMFVISGCKKKEKTEKPEPKKETPKAVKPLPLPKNKLSQHIKADLYLEYIRNSYTSSVFLEASCRNVGFPNHAILNFDLGEGEFGPDIDLPILINKFTYKTNVTFKTPGEYVIGVRVRINTNTTITYNKVTIHMLDPKPTAPFGQGIIDNKPKLSWTKVPFADEYQVVFARDRNFKQIIFNKKMKSLAFKPEIELKANNYYAVKIKPLSDKYPSHFSQTMAFAYIDISMAYIKSAVFLQGKPSDKLGTEDEEPQHKVKLKDYQIDIYEVSIKNYVLFLNTASDAAKHYHREMEDRRECGIYLDGDEYICYEEKKNYPIVFVNYYDALAFAHWCGKRLPTEAEWEYAAKGINYMDYPWGSEVIPGAPVGRGAKKALPVNSFPQGKSVFGLYHVSGNVWEWCNDWYDRFYYHEKIDFVNPQGPPRGKTKALRSGGFGFEAFKSRVTYRDHDFPYSSSASLGFRCAADPR